MKERPCQTALSLSLDSKLCKLDFHFLKEIPVLTSLNSNNNNNDKVFRQKCHYLLYYYLVSWRKLSSVNHKKILGRMFMLLFHTMNMIGDHWLSVPTSKLYNFLNPYKLCLRNRSKCKWFWSLTASGWHSLYKKGSMNILQDIFCVQLKKVSKTGLEQHQDEQMKTFYFMWTILLKF